ncbi:hypothetical protein SEUCBS139899_009043 [Sporothrix eucalyptigena]|uniref:Zn(2)-C6 fungal-type domain-containing protein n=1 Tax=Sporothrix eucalyptigena TaxID=1812306 RepID=A0ABP0C2U5_9PEZI
MAKRTRTGCWTCRGRSVKCDENRPACLKCSKAGLSCSYGMRLTWIEDSIARGTCHGREGLAKGKKRRPGATTSTPTSSYHASKAVDTQRFVQMRKNTCFFINTSYDDMVFYLDTDMDEVRGAKRARQQKHIARDVEMYDEVVDIDINEPDFDLDLDLAPPMYRATEQGLHNAVDPSMGISISRDLGGRWAPLFGNISAAESHLLDFYTAIVCAKATMLDERDHNPFRFILLPMAIASTRVYYGLLAVAASKLAAAATATDGANAYAQALALTYRQYALGGLRQFLSTLRPDHPQDLIEALAAAIPLCWFEVADHCQPTWTDHLAAMSTLLAACTCYVESGGLTGAAEDLVQFAWQYFAYHLVTAKTTFPVQQLMTSSGQTALKSPRMISARRKTRVPAPAVAPPSSPTPTLHQQYLRLRPDPTKDSYVDAYQGFSNTLLFLIDEICELRNTPASTRSVEATVQRIEQSLVCLRQLPPKPLADLFNIFGYGSDSEGSSTASDKPGLSDGGSRFLVLESTAEAHRLGALLFLDETCALCWTSIVPQTRAKRSQLVDQIIDLARAILAAEHVTAAFPVWAVFMAGCMAASCGDDGDDSQRQRILSIFSRLEKTMFRSIPPARKVVEMVWRQQDLTVDENPRLATSWDGSFRTWKRAASSSVSATNDHSAPAGSMAVSERAPRCAQFSWERAMIMMGESRLSLT